MKPEHFIIKIAYDGTAYSGWQLQPNGLAVTNILESSFQSTFNQTISLVGASRTDAGVHALGQVAHFTNQTTIPTTSLLYGWNSTLPRDIAIRSIVKTDQPFHARYDAKKKIYLYHFTLERPLPFISRYAHFFEYHVDLVKLEKTLQLFVGTHDFKLFSDNNKDKTTIRTIDSISLTYVKSLKVYRIRIEGRSFLYHMIRRIVGASLYVSSYKHINAMLIQQLLKPDTTHHMLPNAPAHGLVLYRVSYK